MTDYTNAGNPELEGVMRRVQKLLAIAGDHRADPNEAAAAAAMAEKVMRKYQLEHQDIIVSALKTGDDLTTIDCTAYSFYNKPARNLQQVPVWANWLAVQVGNLMDCGVRLSKNTNGDACVRFYGQKQDAVVAGWMFDYLVTTVKNLCKVFIKAQSKSATKDGAVASYRRGVATGIKVNLEQMVQDKLQAEEEAKAAAPTGFSLMVVKKDALALKYGKFEYPKKKHASVRHAGVYGDGVIDGKKVDLNVRGIKSDGKKTLMIGN